MATSFTSRVRHRRFAMTSSGEVTGGVLVFHDVSESRELNRRLSYHASHDILTGLVNRARVRESPRTCAEECESARDVLRAAVPRSRPVQDRQRLLRTQRWRCVARPAWRIVEIERSAGVTRLRDSAVTSLVSCSKAARLEEAMNTAETLRMAIGEYKFVWEERSFPPRRQYRRRPHHGRQRRRRRIAERC